MCDIPWAAIGRVIAGLLPLIIAGVVAYVAVAQYQINRRQYRLALFEKRLAIFNLVMGRCAEVVNAMASPLHGNIKFIQATRDHEFLFGSEVVAFIDEVWKQGNKLNALQSVQPPQPAIEAEIVDWFATRIPEARKMFFKYINFTDDY